MIVRCIECHGQPGSHDPGCGKFQQALVSQAMKTVQWLRADADNLQRLISRVQVGECEAHVLQERLNAHLKR